MKDLVCKVPKSTSTNVLLCQTNSPNMQLYYNDIKQRNIAITIV